MEAIFENVNLIFNLMYQSALPMGIILGTGAAAIKVNNHNKDIDQNMRNTALIILFLMTFVMFVAIIWGWEDIAVLMALTIVSALIIFVGIDFASDDMVDYIDQNIKAKEKHDEFVYGNLENEGLDVQNEESVE